MQPEKIIVSELSQDWEDKPCFLSFVGPSLYRYIESYMCKWLERISEGVWGTKGAEKWGAGGL